MIKRAAIFGNGRLALFLFVILVIFLSASISFAANTTVTTQPVPPPADEFDWFSPGGEDAVDGPVYSRASELVPATSPLASTAGSMTFTPIADSDVVENFPDLNTGTTNDIWAGYDFRSDPLGGVVRGLVKFDTSSLPAEATIISATLRLNHVNSYGYLDDSLTITTHRITSDWSEVGVTWNNQPGYAGSYGSQSILHNDWGAFDFDVTSLVTDWHGNVYNNYGIMIRGSEIFDTGSRGFGSREMALSEPELIVTYDIPASCNEIIINGGFEDKTSWILPVTEYQSIYTDAPVRNGSWSVRNGIAEALHNTYSYSSAWQTVTLPHDAPYINLRFYLYPQTTEPAYLSLPSDPLGMTEANATSSGDAQLVLILNEYGQEIERLLMMRENIDNWLYYSFDLTHYAGRTIKVYFDVYNNGWAGISSMYVDDVSLQVCTEIPTTGTIEGTVTLQGRSDHSGAEVCADDGSNPVCVQSDAGGAYSIGAAEGSYSVTVDMERYLDAEKLGVSVSADGVTNLQPVTLLGGDTNDDCVINILDLALEGGRVGTMCGDLNWDSRADINDDCIINILDLAVTGGNFGGTCPVPWD